MRALVAIAALGLVACSPPWTVRRIGEETGEKKALSPAAYVESMWGAKLLPAIEGAAADAGAAMPATTEPYRAVKGEGKVLAVDTTSRVGLAMVDVAPFDGKADVSIEIGPVLRGTGLRDVTRLIHFSDFVNQLQFADVANELNDRVLKNVLGGVAVADIKGKTVSFAGVAPTAEGKTRIHDVVPVRLAVTESAKK